MTEQRPDAWNYHRDIKASKVIVTRLHEIVIVGPPTRYSTQVGFEATPVMNVHSGVALNKYNEHSSAPGAMQTHGAPPPHLAILQVLQAHEDMLRAPRVAHDDKAGSVCPL